MGVVDQAVQDGVGQGRIAQGESCQWATGNWLVTTVERV
jgi:hypothetical protein